MPHASCLLRRASSAFTLIETVLTISIIGAGLLGVMYVFTGGTRASLVADQTIVASHLGHEKMEQIMADRSTQGYATTIVTSYSDGALSGDYTPYTRTVTILEVNPDDDGDVDDFLDAQPGSGYARITVNVTWSSGVQKVKLEGLIGDYAL